jgi:hypothetical protein
MSMQVQAPHRPFGGYARCRHLSPFYCEWNSAAPPGYTRHHRTPIVPLTRPYPTHRPGVLGRAWDNPKLLIAIYDYYSPGKIGKRFPGGDYEVDQNVKGAPEMNPGGGTTKINPKEMEAQTSVGLGAILIHEFMHARHGGVPLVEPGSEGEAYGL